MAPCSHEVSVRLITLKTPPSCAAIATSSKYSVATKPVRLQRYSRLHFSIDPQDSKPETQAVVESISSSARNMETTDPPLPEAHLLKTTAQEVVKSTTSQTRDATPADMTPPRPRLLSLPAKLLNYIVTLAVVDSDSTFLSAGVRRDQEYDTRMRCAYPASPGLARTYVHLAAVALPIFYGQNNFAFSSPTQAVDWFNVKSGRYEEPIVRKVEIDFTRDRSKSMSQMTISWRHTVMFRSNAEVNISLKDNADELAVSVKYRIDRWDTAPLGAGDIADIKRELAAKVKETNEETVYARHPSDKIIEICRYLSFGCRE
jgi:hypothetical protein